MQVRSVTARCECQRLHFFNIISLVYMQPGVSSGSVGSIRAKYFTLMGSIYIVVQNPLILISVYGRWQFDATLPWPCLFVLWICARAGRMLLWCTARYLLQQYDNLWETGMEIMMIYFAFIATLILKYIITWVRVQLLTKSPNITLLVPLRESVRPFACTTGALLRGFFINFGVR